MLILDTDHLSEFERGSVAGERLRFRLMNADDEIAACIISVEEQLRGWLAQIHRLNNSPHDQIPIYQILQDRLGFYASWNILPWKESAVDIFEKLRRQKIRIGPMDLKIASIALQHNATLLTRNTVDFAKVPALTIENWLDATPP